MKLGCLCKFLVIVKSIDYLDLKYNNKIFIFYNVYKYLGDFFD